MFATTESTPVLKNVRVPANRFDPETYDQYLTSVYVLWNLLDRIILRHRPDRGMPQMPYGYMRLVQLHSYSRLVWKRDDVRTYCETGINGGHGTAAMLLANPHLVTHSFDLGIQPYSRDVFDLLKLYFGERFNLYVGDSHRTLPQFAANESNHRQCDVILIDGDHGNGAYDDIRDFKPLAACHAHVLLDDTLPTAAGVNAGPRNAIRQAVAQGMIKVVRPPREPAPKPASFLGRSPTVTFSAPSTDLRSVPSRILGAKPRVQRDHARQSVPARQVRWPATLLQPLGLGDRSLPRSLMQGGEP